MADAATTEQQQQQQLPKVPIEDGKMIDFTLAGWTSKLEELKKEAAAIRPASLCMFPQLRAEEAIAAPEVGDKQTDVLELDFPSPNELLKNGSIKKASDLSEAAVMDSMDALLSFLAMYARGVPTPITIETCFYVHDPAAAEGTPLGTFLAALLKTVMQITVLVERSTIRDGDEEFSIGFATSRAGEPLNTDAEVDLAPLEAEAKKGGALGPRFAMLIAIVKMLSAVTTCASEGALKHAEGLDAAAKALKEAAVKLRDMRVTGDAVVPPKQAFTPHGARWDATTMPTAVKPPCAWSEAIETFVELADDLQMVMEKWCPVREDLPALLAAAREYCYREQQATVLTRAAVALVAVSSHQPFGGQMVIASLVAMMKQRFGAPWFAAIAHPQDEADEKLAAAIAEHTQKDAGARGASAEETLRHLKFGVSSTVMEVGRVYLQLIHAFLRNRGRCLRILVNMLQPMVQCQAQVWRLERSAFLQAPQAFTKAHMPTLQRNEVLVALVTDLLHETCQTICVLNAKLGLLTPAETFPVTLYHQHFAGARNELLQILYPSATAAEEFKDVGNRRGAPPAIAARQARQAPVDMHAETELTVAFTRALGYMCAMHKAKMPSLIWPEGSLQPLANVFNHRFHPLQAALQRPALMSYQDIVEVTKVPDVARVTQQAVDSFRGIAQKTPSVRQNVKLERTARLLEAIEKAAKKNAVVSGLIQKMEGFTVALEADAEFPFVVTFNATKVAAN